MRRETGSILAEFKPDVLFFPHDADWNSTHIGTHLLAMDALAQVGRDFACYVVETEFWAPLAKPNLMVEVSEEHLTHLLEALSFHVGEVQRNPYHIGLPPWMIDNVRRGGELVGGQGGAAPDYLFATLYRVRKWNGSELVECFDKGRHLGLGNWAETLFAW